MHSECQGHKKGVPLHQIFIKFGLMNLTTKKLQILFKTDI